MFKSGKGEIHNEEKPYIEKRAKDGAYDFKPEKTPFAAFIKSIKKLSRFLQAYTESP